MGARDEDGIKQEAISRYLNGEKVSSICRGLGRSRQWFYKWLERQRTGDQRWFEEKSRAAHSFQNRIEPSLEQEVVEIRERLMNTRYAQIGANAINWELGKQGIEPLPASTISRVIARHQLTRTPAPRPSKHVNYVNWPALGPNSIHQADIVGPRFIKNDGRFYSFNLMDVATHRVKINPIRSKEDHVVVAALLRSWRKLGLPDFLQLDNALYYWGSRRHPHSFGLLIKVCLRLGVEPVFIPVGEPWRNGKIERFQDVFDKMFFRSQFFPSFAALCEEAPRFEQFHDTHHVYSCLNGLTPCAALGDFEPIPLPQGFTIPSRLLIEDGYIHLIRFIRSDRVLDIFGEKFQLDANLVYEYVVATICTEIHQIQVRHDDHLVHSFDYPIPLEQVSTMSLDKLLLEHC
jgi:transposase InsO family protein